MSKEIKRGLPFPPSYGRDLPRRSDADGEIVRRSAQDKLTLLHVMIKERRLPREEESAIVNSFFDSLPEGVGSWLESDDPQWKKPGGVLIKEHAIQIVQRGKGREFLEGNQETVKELDELIHQN